MPYEYQALQGADIRLLTIEPLEDGEDFSAPIRCTLEHVDLEAAARASGFKGQNHVWPETESTHDVAAIFKDPEDAQTLVQVGDDTKRAVEGSPDWKGNDNDLPWRHDWGDFLALSYVWGPPTPVQHIILNGHQFPVGPNLFQALLHLRPNERIRQGFKLWIDAICINQEDIAERSAQVGRMRDIYAAAWQVVIWLGPGADDSELGMSALSWIAARNRTPSPYDGFYRESTKIDARPLFIIWGTFKSPLKKTVYKALFSLLFRPYWQRMWILQEVAMARPDAPVVCGKSCLPWRDIHEAATFISNDETRFGLQGVIFDTIGSLGSFHPAEVDATYPQNAIPTTNSAYGGLEDTRNALWQTLLGDTTVDGGGQAPEAGAWLLDPKIWNQGVAGVFTNGFGLDELMSRNKKLVLGGHTLEQLISGVVRSGWRQKIKSTERIYNPTEEQREVLSWAMNVTAWRRIIGTTSGRIGLVPAAARAQDKIAVMRGCSTPMVLRASEDRWEVVGECYVHDQAARRIENFERQKLDFFIPRILSSSLSFYLEDGMEDQGLSKKRRHDDKDAEDAEDAEVQGKRTKTEIKDDLDRYTIGWVCALPKEQTAARAMLDEEFRDVHIRKAANDINTYTLGSIGRHMIVIACLPKGELGVVRASKVATSMTSTFRNIKFVLMVGIGGGIPSGPNDVRLGDVVVSTPTGKYPGVVHATPTTEEIWGSLPGGTSCSYCDPSKATKRKIGEPVVHYGLITSGNQVIKDAAYRDRINKSFNGNALCIEMEAAGLMDGFPCLVIRGIYDYADSHKNDAWQEHAAAAAAVLTKELLGNVAPVEVDSERTAGEKLAHLQDKMNDSRGAR
ncbi:heterokaryon incompatibility protein [Colletotrichum kahawae]|uniref:Heterokaryon incompatibility protein n=1 Tax=Colletotrichum kahawae TaxID=34407 RepID=A0AAD9Y859_COLKA|nr:heterokaryon incompatibility protein [Colletotrichum kahawae]